MRQLIYDPAKSGKRMNIVCFISGSGTNYREIVAKNRDHHYLVFTNRPGCGGIAIARENKHEIVELSHIPYLRDVKKRYAPGPVPRNCPERIRYEQDVSRLIESKLGREPDLICLAGYDQWLTDWLVDKYYPRILNVHPGDTTKGYDGLHWVPTAKAILSGDEVIRSTLFIVDKGEDKGPVLVQSKSLNISKTLTDTESRGEKALLAGLRQVTGFAETHNVKTYHDFAAKADEELTRTMARICGLLQDALKVAGDWEIYPLAVSLIAQGRVAIDGRTVYIEGKPMPAYGYRLDG